MGSSNVVLLVVGPARHPCSTMQHLACIVVVPMGDSSPPPKQRRGYVAARASNSAFAAEHLSLHHSTSRSFPARHGLIYWNLHHDCDNETIQKQSLGSSSVVKEQGQTLPKRLTFPLSFHSAEMGIMKPKRVLSVLRK